MTPTKSKENHSQNVKLSAGDGELPSEHNNIKEKPVVNSDTIQQAVCNYPNCNRRISRFNSRWKNYFCCIHQMKLQNGRGLVNYKSIAEALSRQKKKFEEMIDEEKENIRKSKFYHKVLEHRKNCPHWKATMPCIDCFGRGLTKSREMFFEELKRKLGEIR